MYHLLRSAHGMGYEASDVILGEGGAVHARGGSPGGRRVVPLLARGVPLCVHGEVSDDTAVDTVDCRRQAAGRGRYRTQGSADYRTRRQRLCVGAEGRVPVVFSSIKGLRHPLRPIQPHEAVRQVMRDHPVGRRRMCRTVGGSAARGCWGAFIAPLGEA